MGRRRRDVQTIDVAYEELAGYVDKLADLLRSQATPAVAIPAAYWYFFTERAVDFEDPPSKPNVWADVAEELETLRKLVEDHPEGALGPVSVLNLSRILTLVGHSMRSG